ncbi:TPA: hypothetical protein ACH3X1_012721 [Trebouxia sp. C0004]
MQTSLIFSSSVACCQHQHSHVSKVSTLPTSACLLQLSHRQSVRPLKQCRIRRSRPSVSRLQVCAGRLTSAEPWWEKNNPPNMKSITSVQEMVDAMADAGDKLVIVDFYAQWCAACRALFPKLCSICEDNDDIVLLKVDWDQNKPIARPLGVKVLPFFMFYRGADGLLASFSASVSKVQRLRDAIAEHNTDRCYVTKTEGMAQFPDIKPHPSEQDLAHPRDATRLTEEDYEQQVQQEPAPV